MYSTIRRLFSLIIFLSILHPGFTQSSSPITDSSLKVKAKELRTSPIPSKTYDLNPARPIGTIHTYINKDGNTVQSPTYFTKQPEGATALCRDGTYSFSKNRRGTCSHHGGVAKWL